MRKINWHVANRVINTSGDAASGPGEFPKEPRWRPISEISDWYGSEKLQIDDESRCGQIRTSRFDEATTRSISLNFAEIVKLGVGNGFVTR
jgi:hypothetical protein